MAKDSLETKIKTASAALDALEDLQKVMPKGWLDDPYSDSMGLNVSSAIAAVKTVRTKWLAEYGEKVWLRINL